MADEDSVTGAMVAGLIVCGGVALVGAGIGLSPLICAGVALILFLPVSYFFARLAS